MWLAKRPAVKPNPRSEAAPRMISGNETCLTNLPSIPPLGLESPDSPAALRFASANRFRTRLAQ